MVSQILIGVKLFILMSSRFRAKPWYKPESRGLGAMLDSLAVMTGYYDFLPSPEFKSEGFRLEELVRSSTSILSTVI